MKTVYFFSGLHPIQESIIKHPPPDYKVISNISSSDFDIIKEYSLNNTFIKTMATKLYNLFQQPRLLYINKKCDLIHTTSGVIPINKKPFVVSAEYYSSFVGLQHEKALEGRYYKNIKKWLSSNNCKKILPFSEASKISIINAFNPKPNEFQNKIEVLYPAIEPIIYEKMPRNDKIKILHIGSGFFEKGGRELFRAVDILNDKYKLDVELYAITNAPAHYKDKFENFINKYRFKQNFHIITEKIPRNILYKYYYSQSDIFVLPSYGDLFGYVFLEAMAAGLPLIGTDVFAIPEIIEDNENGFLVKTPISPFKPNYLRKSDEEVEQYLYNIINNESTSLVDSLVEKLRILIEDKQLRKRMGQNSFKLVKEGKFSITQRNKKLTRIYDEALMSN